MDLEQIIITFIASIGTLLVSGLLNRRRLLAEAHKIKAEAHEITERAESLDITSKWSEFVTLQASVKWWENAYGDVVKRSDALKEELDAVSAHFEEFKASANLSLENLRVQLKEEQQQRRAQAAELIKLQNRVNEMQVIIDEQAITIQRLNKALLTAETGRLLLKEQLATVIKGT